MLLAPSDKPYDYRNPPRLALGLAGLLLLLAFVLFPGDYDRQQGTDQLYNAQLLNTEWPLYGPFLMQNGRSREYLRLETDRAQGRTDLVARQLGYDRAFVENIRKGGKDYLPPEVLSDWSAARTRYDEDRNRLSAQVIGLDPQRFRPVTFISYAFTDLNLNSVLLSVVLLLLAGMPLERMLGSGAVLGSWAAGSVAGGLAYLVTHHRGVMPMTGSTHAVLGVIGAAFWVFRGKASLRLLESALTLGGWILLLTAAVTAGLVWQMHSSDPAWLVSMGAALAAGIAAGIFAVRLDQRRQLAQPEIIPPELPTSEPYRQDINQVMQKLSQMQFVAAEKNIRGLLEKYPNDPRLMEQLYHLVKLSPNNLEFEEIAFVLLTLPNQARSNHVSLRIYRDYVKRSHTFVALDENTCLQLVLRFTRINALKDAEEAFKRALDANRQAPLLAKAASALAQALVAANMEQRAGYYANLAKSG
ncbi:MAG TPA: rhomboid family intramembrane serine protease [Fluviicoccus sp.]|nr:rhomboid family intramembrane serine protease [Fluviicoccus sp.]